MCYKYTATPLSEEIQLGQYLFGGQGGMQIDQVYGRLSHKNFESLHAL